MSHDNIERRQRTHRKEREREDDSNGEGFSDARDGKVDPDVPPTENAE